MKIRVSEIFLSIEGEGPYTGWPMLFVRSFGCNFTCSGFSKKPFALDYSNVISLHEIDKVEHGCDSSYAWHGSAKHLAKFYETDELADEILNVIETATGNRSFVFPNGQEIILCFTGGEPMMWQEAIKDTVKKLEDRKAEVYNILFETNGTRELKAEFKEFMKRRTTSLVGGGLDKNLIFAVSPKLSNSGEAWEEAIRPEVVVSYKGISNEQYLKFVCDGEDSTWEEIERAIGQIGVDATDVWIMPEAATEEQQKQVAEKIAIQCIQRGYKYCHRTHVSVFGNKTMT